jgi:hypothetical protein
MIFSHTLDLVLSGVKSQTRRLKKPHEHLYPTEPGTVYGETRAGIRRVYQVGMIYAVQPGRAKKAVAFIRLTAIRDQRVMSISEADAIAEGFDSPESFFAAWRAIHGAKADLQAWVWVLEFELCEEESV